MTSRQPTSPEGKAASGDQQSDITSTELEGEESINAAVKEATPTQPEKRSATKTVLVLVSVLMSMFLVALDRTIISTAIPRITDEFNSLSDVGWVYTLFPIREVLLMITFIVGRAIAGVGAAGIFAGVVVCIALVIPVEKRPQIQGLFGGLMGVSSIAGPLIGGGFTSNVTWRWCFYINLPFGALALVVIFFLLDTPDRETTKLPFTAKLLKLDFLGTGFMMPGVICLLLALQWGGQQYAWSNWRIILLLVLSGALLIAFAAVQLLCPTTATLPARIFKQRSLVAGFWSTLCMNSGNYILVYFLPVWFQSIKGVSAAQSGIKILPLMLSMVAVSIGSGFLSSKIGYYTPLAIMGSCVMAVGFGLFTTLQLDTEEAKWVGYQIIYGIGLGCCFQVPNLAAQVTLPKKDIPTGLALLLFGTLLGAAVFVSVGENVLGNQLVQRLSWVPGFNRELVISSGATSLLDSLPEDMRQKGLADYNEALREVFKTGLVPSCLSVLGAVSLEWRSVKKKVENDRLMQQKEVRATHEAEVAKE
ncbi:uncharacterized protein BHQ10_006724 [Talaromyces amestolkiae]|uniref:Major facilitator superfamily (MFS) profile domain-containing protein n=1 Tax=Talaromyces amestolkiae TaxID=1196081 RepID=A0A364L4J2_TALAM|nr:uncharacterized protein BHQ10_006724 [Talaromyces amestolkiae]RAO70712.1 hypothetical protein BHQ10_006724 [Talaromyces amestolkiae]